VINRTTIYYRLCNERIFLLCEEIHQRQVVKLPLSSNLRLASAQKTCSHPQRNTISLIRAKLRRSRRRFSVDKTQLDISGLLAGLVCRERRFQRMRTVGHFTKGRPCGRPSMREAVHAGGSLRKRRDASLTDLRYRTCFSVVNAVLECKLIYQIACSVVTAA
jgi:hypothetical protein